jgi:hypothetical protein
MLVSPSNFSLAREVPQLVPKNITTLPIDLLSIDKL